MNPKEEFLLRAFPLGIIQFGRFTLKSGLESPFYVDLRSLASSPELLKTLSNRLLEKLGDVGFDLICGVPYAALPMATTMSLESGVPLIIKRKENKGYGTKKILEGIYKQGQKCLLVDDVITSGLSLMETLWEIEKEGLVVKDICVVLDRAQGGVENLKEKGYNVHSLFNIHEVLDILLKHGHLDQEKADEVRDFVNRNDTAPVKQHLTYTEKAEKQKGPMAREILMRAEQKQTNLICSADLQKKSELLNLARSIGDEIVALKLHADIIEDFDTEFIDELKKLAKEKSFFLIEDRKFADIGHTMKLQFEGGVHKIATWADMITTPQAFGDTALIAIVEMSSKGSLTDNYYVNQALEVAEKCDNIIGAVAQRKVSDDLILFTPGVNLESTSDAIGQQYKTPQSVFGEIFSDFIIVGRGIYANADPLAAAKQYREAGWQAYTKAIEKEPLAQSPK
ncbi:unnamed protein product [Cyprideis torosa]|uniref:Uridine 5'-monophosphate synthase n=1 Tax=Cyprideis torosa TaxID=163714 RepID=A0A7R8ZWL3_9CRUS|nr:unnamed protein product [Cyprideis torosa]CAG0905133.1 unnamed protein product [Cyprideis torosa]